MASERARSLVALWVHIAEFGREPDRMSIHEKHERILLAEAVAGATGVRGMDRLLALAYPISLWPH